MHLGPRFSVSLLFVPVALITAIWCHGQTPSPQGQWSALENWPTRAVHTTLLPDGRVYFISYYDESLQPNIWDPSTNTFAPAAAAPYELFCAGHTQMADGRVFIAGGHIADYTGYAHSVIYDPNQNTVKQVPDMNEGRWYPTTTVLPNGDILVTSGDVNSNTVVDPLPQVFQVSSGTWRDLTSAQLMQALYPVMFVAPNGQVIYAGPEPLSRYLNTSGTGAWTSVATHQFTSWRDYGPGVMYGTGKILEVGGSDPPTATAETIDLTQSSPAWKYTGSMHYPRRQHNAVIMPDGKVFIVGGSSGGGFDDHTHPVYPTEMWDPATGQFTVMASIAVYRGYHSTALLLPDGRVLSAGGNVGGANAQVFSPPYLSAGSRPTIASAPSSVGYGQTVFVGTPNASNITQVTFLRDGSVTHTFDESARFMRLSFTQVSGGLNIAMPANGNLAPPGHYMLFLLNSAGVPSVAKIIQITAGGGSTATLSGTVTDDANQPLAGVQIMGGAGSAITAQDGTYTLSNVPIGSATVNASLAGYQSASQTVTISSADSVNVPVIQLVPVSPGGITGSVVDSNGNSIAGATVTALGLTTTTTAAGAFSLSNVPAGTVTLDASAPGYKAVSETVVVSQGSNTTAPPITLTSNVGNVSGKVLDAANNPITGASVSFGGGSATTDGTGSYSFTRVPAGTIQLVASASGYQSVTQNVTITGGTTVTANFSLSTAASAMGSITGIVTNISNNGPIAGAVVTWNGNSATANSSGVYTLSNVAGGTQTVSAKATGYLRVSSTVSVTGGVTTLNFKLSTAGILNVKVLDASGAPVTGAAVTLSGGVIATSLAGTTNASGIYSSNWIPIGNYTVTSGSVGTNATVLVGKTSTITLTEPSSAPTTGTVSGGVTNSSGLALSGVTVSAGGLTTTTQSSGSYTLVGVSAGTVMVSASASGYQTATQTVIVSGGATANANFALTSTALTGTITGKVTNISNGAALIGATVKWNGTAVSTNSSGIYTIANATAGSQSLTGSATGYLARSATVNVVSGGSATLNFQLATAGLIKVTASNSAGLADAGASVTIKGGVINTTFNGKTNSSGAYSTSWTPVGSYTITISESGHTTQTKSATVSAGATTTVHFVF